MFNINAIASGSSKLQSSDGPRALLGQRDVTLHDKVSKDYLSMRSSNA